MTDSVRDWMETVSGPEWYWYVKRLSGNDTLLNKSHQAGPYLPKSLVFRLFPSLTADKENPRASFGAMLDSHNLEAFATVIWYNNRFRGGTRNECRITNWGGQESPLLDPESTGSLCVFAFHQTPGRDADICDIWLCRTIGEEDAVEDRVEPVEPGAGIEFDPSGLSTPASTAGPLSCRLTLDEIPEAWRLNFPEASEIVRCAVDRTRSVLGQTADDRLLKRRECEYEVFRSLEEAIVMPRIREGFATVDLFVDFANSVTNRRKSRAGRSLELHAEAIFREDGLTHSHNEVSEGAKRPDFLFPSGAAYRDQSFPAERLLMLAAKTTCKDRWRQILNEADRIKQKHLLTLQRGVSPSQFTEMKAAGVVLVVPRSLHEQYDEAIRPELLSLSGFIELARR